MKRILLATASILALAACNTFHGMGEDISAMGHALTGASDDTKQGIENTEHHDKAVHDNTVPSPAPAVPAPAQ